MSVPASGGNGRVSVTTARECSWTATSSTSWLTIRGPASGQGDGSVEFVAATNSDPASRRGVIALNDKQASVTQAAADCSVSLADSSASFSQAGGSGSVQVRTSSAQCTWSASADASWIVIRSGSTGSGNGSVAFDVPAFSGAPRTGTITVAGQRYAVTQSQGCTYAISPSTFSTESAGGTTTVSVTAGAGCPWTAASNVSWASVTQGASGSGPGTVQVVVDATGGSSRSGSVLIAGQPLAITQTAGCSYTVQPTAHTFDAGGGNGSSTVTTGSGCAWSASTGDSWITLMGPNPGNGSGTFGFSVAPLSGPGRTGTISLAGSDVTVTQGSGCAFSISPQGQQVDAAGGDITVNVTGTSGCSWTTGSSVPWITIAAGATGVGNGTVRLTVSATSGGSRTGTATIAGQPFTVTQGSGCAYSISPTSASAAAGGGSGSVTVTAGSGCAWSASSAVSWLTITSGANGSGNGTVQDSVASMSGGARAGTMTIAGQTFTVNQGSGCSFAISPQNTSVAAAGGTGNVSVTAGSGCAWTAKSNDSWITVTSGATGSGNGTVAYSVASTGSTGRAGTITIGDQTFTVNQGSGCSVSINPSDASPGSGASTGSVSVSAGNGCAWTASSNASWLTIPSGANGSGNGTVNYSVAANSEGARNGTLTIGGKTFTVNQAGGCTFNVSPTTIATTALGGNETVTVTAPQGCAWTATSSANWIDVASPGDGKGSGNGNVRLSIEVNTGGARAGTATVAGRQVTVNQAAVLPCTWTLEPTSDSKGKNGGNDSFKVTLQTGSNCSWTATSNASWIHITSGASGNGSGTVAYTVDRNTGNDRIGTITAAGRTFTVTQN